MILNFECYCKTHWGQRVYVVGSIAELGNWNVDKALPLECCDLNRWRATIELNQYQAIQYRYVLVDTEQNIRTLEKVPVRSIPPQLGSALTYYCNDTWQLLGNEIPAYFSSAFTNILFKSNTEIMPPKTIIARQALHICCRVPLLKPTQYVAISGDCNVLGSWKKFIPLIIAEGAVWYRTINLDYLPKKFEYKLVILDTEDPNYVCWEKCDNHVFENNYGESGFCVKADLGVFEYDYPNVKIAGVNVPVFSLRSRGSFGVGDFSDIKDLIDWSAKVGLKMIQLLPINDTISTYSFLDSYPYNANSVFALNPLFINIDLLDDFKDANVKLQYRTDKKALNANSSVDYVEVIKKKLFYSRQIFNDNKKKILESKHFKTFIEENKEWLIPYAAFSLLRDKLGTSRFNSWGKYAKYTRKIGERLCAPNADTYDDAMFWCYLQFELDRQLRTIINYAHKHNIIIKGDIPIGISRYSVDAWCLPTLFNFKGQAGAPPDYFSTNGQNWGFPTYNWAEMEKDNYAWWRNRMVHMSKYFDAYRIDHILGFFRIWEIPTTAVYGIFGHFNPDIPLTTTEMQQKGLNFDIDETCVPTFDINYINSLFGNETSKIIDIYLEKQPDGLYRFKPEYKTQRSVYNKAIWGYSRKAIEYSKMKQEQLAKLTALSADVLFFKCNGGYQPNISMRSTSTYNRLPSDTKRVVDAIYDDYFFSRHNNFWRNEAMKKFTILLTATSMLVCGEDLGMIPSCVKPIMDEFGILSLELQRMPKRFTEFENLHTIPYTSVCATSTHDIAPIRGWWIENRDTTQRYYNNCLGLQGEAPQEATPEICKMVIDQHLQSQAMCVVVPIQDFFALDANVRCEDVMRERINEPSNPRNYWKYRMHITLWNMKHQDKLNNQITEMLKAAGRV